MLDEPVRGDIQPPSSQPGSFSALCREKDHYDPTPSDKAALLSLPHWVLRHRSCGQVSPLLSLRITKAAVASLKHNKGKTVQMFFNTQASCQGPSRIQLLVLSKASMSQSHNPQQTDSLPGFLAAAQSC